ncbi:MAG: hypothetical protein EZS28_017934 [Streblomastix strix]|uniref:Uncharacterized protein n=1 Tax=Streblomastix strix TaxID=222440 RepID=A0A5J4VW82_9EUKA|nr:MAG: hypothetical protein EZS28_017934 [Streblomastix strix]
MGRPSLKLIGIEEEIALTCYAGKESEKVFDFYVKKALIALLAFNVIVARESYVQMMSLYSQIEHHSARYLGLIVQIKMDLDRMSGVDKNEDEMKEQDLIDKFGFERDEDQDNIEDELFGIDRKRDVERDADDGEDKKKDRQRKEKEKKVGEIVSIALSIYNERMTSNNKDLVNKGSLIRNESKSKPGKDNDAERTDFRHYQKNEGGEEEKSQLC